MATRFPTQMLKLPAAVACVTAAFAWSIAAEQPWPLNKATAQMQHIEKTPGGITLRLNGVSLLLLTHGQNICGIMALPEQGNKANETVQRLMDIIGWPSKLATTSNGSVLHLQAESMQHLAQHVTSVFSGSGLQFLAYATTQGNYSFLRVETNGNVVLLSPDKKAPAIRFNPLASNLTAVEVFQGKPSPKEAKTMTQALGLGNNASVAAQKKLAQNLDCPKIYYYNALDEVCLADTGNGIFLGTTDAIQAIAQGKRPEAPKLTFPKKEATWPKIEQSDPAKVKAALRAYMDYLKRL